MCVNKFGASMNVMAHITTQNNTQLYAAAADNNPIDTRSSTLLSPVPAPPVLRRRRRPRPRRPSPPPGAAPRAAAAGVPGNRRCGHRGGGSGNTRHRYALAWSTRATEGTLSERNSSRRRSPRSAGSDAFRAQNERTQHTDAD
jgi:hypothetical protein